MLNRWKRLLALLASVAVLFSLCTAASAAPGGQAEPRELTAADYAAADAIFASLPSADGTNGGTAGAADTGALCDWLETADGVRPGTVSANGSCVTWQTDAGITCSYNPQLVRISERAQEPAQTQTLESTSALRGVQHGLEGVRVMRARNGNGLGPDCAGPFPKLGKAVDHGSSDLKAARHHARRGRRAGSARGISAGRSRR